MYGISDQFFRYLNRPQAVNYGLIEFQNYIYLKIKPSLNYLSFYSLSNSEFCLGILNSSNLNDISNKTFSKKSFRNIIYIPPKFHSKEPSA